MRDVPASIAETWADGVYVGQRRPIARVTVQHPGMKLRNFSLTSAFTRHVELGTKSTDPPVITLDLHKGQKVHQTYADFLFTTMGVPMELPNVRSVSWTRSIDTDIADVTVECWNTAPLPIGVQPSAGELDLPGFYTYSRGGSAFSSRWMHTRNEWFGMLAPDNIIRTYEGYGFDASVGPAEDENLVLTGVWIIDTVAMSATGTLSIKARDIGRILMDQSFLVPLVPKDFYNEGFSNFSGIYERDPSTTRLKVKPQDSSNTPWIGIDHSVDGHKLSMAFDGDPNTYWVSIGNDAPSRRFAYEWVQCSVNNQSVSEVRVRTKKKGYIAYVSVKVAGVWQGTKSINYHEDGIGVNGGDIAYVATTAVNTEQSVSIKFKTIKKVEAVRVTLGNLQDFHFGTYHYRGGIRDVEVYASSTTTRNANTGPAGANPGYYNDYTDLIKLFCAWGGFFWPAGGRQRQPDTHPAFLTVDANAATYWQGDPTDTNPSLTIDLGQSRTYKQVVVRVPPAYAAQGQTYGLLQSSDGNRFRALTHTTTTSLDSGTGVRTTNLVFAAGTSRRYLRLNVHNSAGVPARVGSFEIYNDASTPPATANLAAGYPVTATATQPVYTLLQPTKYDTGVLGKGVRGRVWGDFQETGTNGPAALDATNFDKKTLLECIGYIRDILGFVFFIDETGGVQWRFPNIQNRGCYRTSISANPGYVTDFAHQIDENTVLMTLDCTIDSKNVREMIFVGDGLGKVGAYAPGFNPNPTGLRRVTGWTDAGFGAKGGITNGKDAQKQCELMADLISLRQLFTYRKDRVRIPANPAIQIDDQVRIFERTTAEGYVHYVTGIASSLDMSTGEWTYDLDTHWLGYDPKSRWIFKPEQLKKTTQDYMKQIQRNYLFDVISRIPVP